MKKLIYINNKLDRILVFKKGNVHNQNGIAKLYYENEIESYSQFYYFNNVKMYSFQYMKKYYKLQNIL